MNFVISCAQKPLLKKNSKGKSLLPTGGKSSVLEWALFQKGANYFNMDVSLESVPTPFKRVVPLLFLVIGPLCLNLILTENSFFFTNSWRNSEQRWFFIVTSHGVCATDGGYIVTVDNVGHCNYDDRLGYPQFLYSPNYLNYSMFDEGTVTGTSHYENMLIQIY